MKYQEHMPSKKRKRIELVTKETPKGDSTSKGDYSNKYLKDDNK